MTHDPALLLEEVSKSKSTILETVPSLLRTINESGDGQTELSLRWMIPTGEALPPEMCRRWLEQHPDIPLLNAYGPTECSDDVTHYAIYDSTAENSINIPIGRPVANIQAYILHNNLRPVPTGITGELYIGGVGVGRGYLNDAVRTAEAFIPDPFGQMPGARLYKTGDVARRRPDGNIEFLGRADQQVKIRGFRIELEEIEAVLGAHADLRQVVVVAREDIPGQQRLVAYFVAQEGKSPSVSDLRRFVGDSLPDYMVPTVFHRLDSIPLTSNGKIDRKALPAPDPLRDESDDLLTESRTPVQAALTQIWRDLLRIDRISIHDNFFTLGGDSILTLQVVARAARLGIHLTPKQIFQHQTIEGLAAVCDFDQSARSDQGLVTGSVPLTPLQVSFLYEEETDLHHWNQAVMLESPADLDLRTLQQAIAYLPSHHDALRMRFKREASGWAQTIIEKIEPIPFLQVDLSSLNRREQQANIERIAAGLQSTLDLTDGPLARVAFFELGFESPPRLMIMVHHLVIDGVSWRILLEDIQTIYNDLKSGDPARLPSKTTSFKRWAERLVESASSEMIKREADYWLATLESGNSNIPLDHPNGVNAESSARRFTLLLDAEDTIALMREVPRTYNIQIEEALLASLTQVLSQWTLSSSVLVEVERHGRENIFEDEDVSRTVGLFTTAFPLALTLKESWNRGEALKSIKEQIRSVPGRGIGYGLLRYLTDDAEISQKLNALPRPELSFNYLGQFDNLIAVENGFRPAAESTGPSRSLHAKRRYLIDVSASVVNGCLELNWVYSENLHRHETIQNLAQKFVESIKAVIADCKSSDVSGYTPSDFPLAQLAEEQFNLLLETVEFDE
jgi:non-ribosomal peptide synthase protein (TIGR01720 family)